jgi:poly-gamma-glutamate synthesis protein (capsule biosynthesis protein)
MQSDNVKFKIIFLTAILVFFSGCAEKATTINATSLSQPANQLATQNSVEKKPVKILFVGDMMFDRYIREAVGKYGKGDYGYIFSNIKDQLNQYDLVVGNLEGPITKKTSVSVGTAMDDRKNLVFSFDPAVADTLDENNIKLVGLGNNHILNQGKEGASETKKYLNEAGVRYFGDMNGESEEYLEIGFPSGNPISQQIRIGFVSYNYSAPGSFERAIKDIKSLKEKLDIVVVCPHWGTEYRTGDPGKNIREMGHQFVEAGADLVIGTHPHVIESSEDYKGKKIFYSLGNFVFDQYFSPDTMRGLAVEVEINPADESIKFQEMPVEMMKNGKTDMR